MNKIILLLLLLLSSFFSNSQTTDTSATSNENIIYDIVDSVAAFPGGKAGPPNGRRKLHRGGCAKPILSATAKKFPSRRRCSFQQQPASDFG